MKHLDFSLSFSLRHQTVEEVRAKFEKFLKADHETISEKGSAEGCTTLHHCFLHRAEAKKKGFGTKVSDFLAKQADNVVCWNGASDKSLDMDRSLMFATLKRLNGVAVFIGDDEGGVADELDYAKAFGLDVVLLA